MDYMLEGGCAWLESMQLALAGDWAYTGRVEGAWLSGRRGALGAGAAVRRPAPVVPSPLPRSRTSTEMTTST